MPDSERREGEPGSPGHRLPATAPRLVVRPRANRPRVMLVLFVAAAGATAWLWWALIGRVPVVDLSSAAVRYLGSHPPPPPLYISPVLARDRSSHVYAGFADYLSRCLQRPVRVLQRRTYREVYELLRRSRLDLAALSTGAFLRSQSERVLIEAVAVPIFRHGEKTQALVIVGAQSPYQTINDLQGHSFAFTDPLSLIGHYYPVSLLSGDGADPHTFFASTLFTYSHVGSVRAVLDGVVDAAAVDSRAFAEETSRDPELGARIRVIHQSPPLGNQPFVVPRAQDPVLREAIRAAMLRMSTDERGARVLADLGVERFANPVPEMYVEAAEVVARARRHLQVRP